MASSAETSISSLINYRPGVNRLCSDGHSLYLVTRFDHACRKVKSLFHKDTVFADYDLETVIIVAQRIFYEIEDEELKRSIHKKITRLKRYFYRLLIDSIRKTKEEDAFLLFEKENRRSLFFLERLNSPTEPHPLLRDLLDHDPVETQPLLDDPMATAEELHPLSEDVASCSFLKEPLLSIDKADILFKRMLEISTIEEIAPGLRHISYSGDSLSSIFEEPTFYKAPQLINIMVIDPTHYDIDITGQSFLGITALLTTQAINKTGAFINGGFFVTDFWGQRAILPLAPLGVLKTANFDNTSDLPEVPANKPFFSPLDKSLELYLSSATHTPYEYRDVYGVLVINVDRSISIYPQHVIDSNPRIVKIAYRCLGTGPLLVSRGKKTFKTEYLREKRFKFKFIARRFGLQSSACPPGSLYHADQPNPRSAIGIRHDGSFLMVTSVGRSDSSIGFRLDQLASFMQGLGAVDALALDGGYSSFFGFKDPHNNISFSSSNLCETSEVMRYRVGSIILAQQK